MASAAHIQQAGELALFLQQFNQASHRLGRSADGNHARRGVHSGFNIGVLRVLGNKVVEVFDGEFNNCHSAALVLRQRRFALAHQA